MIEDLEIYLKNVKIVKRFFIKFKLNVIKNELILLVIILEYLLVFKDKNLKDFLVIYRMLIGDI